MIYFALWSVCLPEPTDHNAKKSCSGIVLHMHCGKNFELSSSLSMDVTRAELEIQESRQ